ncbi:hypothetical protein ACOSQ3_014696 [Xanthoceras sorbifolium]
MFYESKQQSLQYFRALLREFGISPVHCQPRFKQSVFIVHIHFITGQCLQVYPIALFIHMLHSLKCWIVRACWLQLWVADTASEQRTSSGLSMIWTSDTTHKVTF